MANTNKIIIDVVANTDYSQIDKAQQKVTQLGESAEKSGKGFANASECTETTVRRVFLHKQRMTLNLFLRFCFALEINPIDLLNKIEK